MVNIERLIEIINDPEIIASAYEEAKQIAIVAEARYLCAINDFNNEVSALKIRQEGRYY